MGAGDGEVMKGYQCAFSDRDRVPLLAVATLLLLAHLRSTAIRVRLLGSRARDLARPLAGFDP